MIFLINDKHYVRVPHGSYRNIYLLGTEHSHHIGSDLRPVAQIIRQFMADHGILIETCIEAPIWRVSFSNGDVLWVAAKTQKAAGRRYQQLATLWRTTVCQNLNYTEDTHGRNKWEPKRISRVKNAEDYGHRKIYF